MSQSLYLWDVKNNFTLLPTKPICYCFHGAFTYDSSRIITTGTNGVEAVNADVWNASTLELITKYTEHTSSILTLAVSKVKDLVVTSSANSKPNNNECNKAKGSIPKDAFIKL